MEYLDKLNPEQRKAAVHKDGPLLILAGAGSGKTNTMTHRIAYLIKEEGVSPYNILAVTFTNKAANEMRERVESLIGPGLRMWILTFHSSCLRILRAHAEKVGYKKDFTVYDPTDQKVVIKAIVKERRLDEKKFAPPYVLSQISDAKEKGVNPGKYFDLNSNHPVKKVVADIYADYDKTLRKNNAMDFDDLILRTVELFNKHDEILKEYQERFKYIMVDEYQDTNYMQYQYVRLLAEGHNNICVVGDDDQCIYEWRGADINNILDFEKDFKGTKVIKLEQNYRSHANILDAANSVIKNNKSRKKKKLWTDIKGGDKVKYFTSYDEKDEARNVAREITTLVEDHGYNYRDIAILYRTNVQSRVFEEELSGFEIPYRVLGGVRYYDRKEIKDILSYMRLVQNPDDDVSLARVINEPKRGIGGKSYDKITAYAGIQGVSAFEALKDDDIRGSLSAKSQVSLKDFMEVITEYAEEKDSMKVSDIYDGLLVRSGYLGALENTNTVEAESRIENLMEFNSVINTYEAEDPNLTLTEFLEKVTLISDIDNHDADENAIVLMTMHSAKGLEFPVVFMPGMEEGLFPSWRAYEKPDGLDEERRLCYVGMTRAKDKLYLSSAKARTLYGKFNRAVESKFLKEIDKKYLDGAELIGAEDHKIGANDGFASKDVYSPFDQVAEIKKHVKMKDDKLGLHNGDKVNHNKFGTGVVLEADEDTVTIMFDDAGKKKLVNDTRSPIEKI